MTDSVKNVTVKVFDEDEFFAPMSKDHTWIPDTLDRAIQWMQEHLWAVPPQYRADVKFDLDARSEYDCGVLHMEISYRRPETDAEATAWQEASDAALRREKKQDIAEFKRIMNKYHITVPGVPLGEL